MKLGLHKVWDGIRLIKQSVLLVIEHPVLLVYGICSFIISSLISLVVFLSGITLFYTSTNNAEVSPTFFISMFLFIILVTCVSLFFLACLAHHAMQILHNELHSVRETINAVVSRLKPLSLWCIFKIALNMPWMATVLLFGNSYLTFFISITALWFIIVAAISYVTSLVLIILATEQTGIIAAVKRSYRLVTDFFMFFLGIFVIFTFFGFNKGPLSTLVEHLGMLTYTIFYYEYYVKPKRELAGILYPNV